MRTVSCLTLACLIGSAMPAFCQAPATNDRIRLDVTRAELQVIGQGLMELPYKSAAPVMNDLQAQLNAADAQAAKAAAEKAKADDKSAEKPAE
jgi:hypothetical protein